MLLALCTPALADTDAEVKYEIVYPEGALVRVLSLAAGAWRLSGPDADQFRIAAGALRFAFRPNFEAPSDADGDSLYEVTVRRTDSQGSAIAALVRVDDRDEPGRVTSRPSRPVVGETLTLHLTDPDRDDTAPISTVRWERWQAPGIWRTIPDAAGIHYTPTAADAGHPLRAAVSYSDRHGPDRQAEVVIPHPVAGPMLSALEVRADSAGSAWQSEDFAMRPAFDPRILNYGLRCAERDVVTVSFSAPSGTMVSVNGIQPAPGAEGSAAVSAAQDSAAVITVVTNDGAYTDYTIHCMPSELWAIRTEPDPAVPLNSLLAVVQGPWAGVIDEHGVSRAHRRSEGVSAGFLLRPFGSGPAMRWAHAEHLSAIEAEALNERLQYWQISDRNLNPLRTVSTAAPLTTTGRHDFRLLDDGSALLMTYEPSVRDLSLLEFPNKDGKPFGAAEQMRDSAIQLQGPEGEVRWTWSAWGRIPPEDCTQHRFPDDWAHVNSIQWTEQGVLASFRGCSTVVMLDPEARSGEEIIWRLGASNLAPEEWVNRGLGPPPLRIVGDSEDAFCGQHAAQLLLPPEGLELPRLLLFDNGVACVTDPRTGDPIGRHPNIYSRAVEYALDLNHGEAIFVRDHALGGSRDMLGYAGGHVELLPGGFWLVSWGGRGQAAAAQNAAKPHSDAVTQVDPETGAESFRIPAAESIGVRALPVSSLSMMKPAGALDVVVTDVLPAEHAGPGDSVAVAVAFSRPVAAFGPKTRSIAVLGGKLTEVAPLIGFGLPAHAWELTLAPAGNFPLQLLLRSGIACAGSDAGICTADGERLKGVPALLTIPRLTGTQDKG